MSRFSILIILPAVLTLARHALYLVTGKEMTKPMSLQDKLVLNGQVDYVSCVKLLSAWLRFRIRKWAHLRREMSAALEARARLTCMTSYDAPPRVFFLFFLPQVPRPNPLNCIYPIVLWEVGDRNQSWPRYVFILRYFNAINTTRV